jgi:ribosome biogenesis protein MAK21
MAKGKGKRESGANEDLQKGGASATDSQSADIPQFDDGAFAGLRQKIEQRLNNQSSGKGKSKKDKKPQPSIETAKKEKDTPKAGKNQGSAQGKKRDRNGDVIAREEQKGDQKKQGKSEGPKKSIKNDTLREEILALGGTEEDLDLLDGVDSESEVEGAPSKGKKGGDEDLRKELSKMLEAAGHVVPDDLEDDEAEAEEEDAEAEAEDEDEEDDIEEDDIEEADDGSEADSEDASEPEESDIEEAPPVKPTKKEPEVVVPKEFAKLVSADHLLS